MTALVRLTAPDGALPALIHWPVGKDWAEVSGVGPVPADAVLELTAEEAVRFSVRSARTRAAPPDAGQPLGAGRTAWPDFPPGSRLWIKMEVAP